MHFSARVAFVGLLCACAGAQAQVQEEIRRCASITADSERLACYDRLFRDPDLQSRAPAAGAAAGGAAAGAGSQPAAGAAPAGAATSGANPANAEFGTNPRMQEQQRRKEPGSAEPQELHARITKVEPHPYGLHVLTLENGQIWQQKEKVWELELKPGDAVVIRRGMLGSYRLQPDGKSISASVTRIK